MEWGQRSTQGPLCSLPSSQRTSKLNPAFVSIPLPARKAFPPLPYLSQTPTFRPSLALGCLPNTHWKSYAQTPQISWALGPITMHFMTLCQHLKRATLLLNPPQSSYGFRRMGWLDPWPLISPSFESLEAFELYYFLPYFICCECVIMLRVSCGL